MLSNHGITRSVEELSELLFVTDAAAKARLACKNPWGAEQLFADIDLAESDASRALSELAGIKLDAWRAAGVCDK
ncbi:MAG: hypothetical protein ACHREM_05700 [Polyangiales bacterium]